SATAKPDPDVAAASVVESASPRKRSIPLAGHTLAYTVTPGTLTIRNDEGAPIASMFYTAYTVDTGRGRPRPITFLFNGGPGSSSMWLHMGSFGPIKIDASIPEMERPAPFRLAPNPDTLLDKTDLVFLDAVTTGLSRPLGKAKPEDFFGVDKDIDAFARGIQRYLSAYGRWNSPKFIIGESYGTTRAAGLSYALADRGVQLNGVVLVSTVLNFADFSGDQSAINFLPTYAADAWYHGKIADKPPLDSFMAQARVFASGPYASALQKGLALGDAEKQSVAQQMARLTGLSSDYILRSNLRVSPDRFRRELLRDQRRIIGRIDSRYLGTESDAAGEGTSYDPQSSSISGAFIGALNDYLFRDLGYQTPLSYRPNNYAGIGEKWDLKHKSAEGFQNISDTSVDLAAAMRQNPRLRLLSVNGYYDLATPFFGADYEIGHMMVEPSIAANIRYVYYPAGHMMYIDPVSAKRLNADLNAFYDSAM
ncbi:MAG: peptidase S10, partial [Sphingomonadaceae bacterium]|nr:peptidase S10 [Sphingomonadaceae bacterium]